MRQYRNLFLALSQFSLHFLSAAERYLIISKSKPQMNPYKSLLKL